MAQSVDDRKMEAVIDICDSDSNDEDGNGNRHNGVQNSIFIDLASDEPAGYGSAVARHPIISIDDDDNDDDDIISITMSPRKRRRRTWTDEGGVDSNMNNHPTRDPVEDSPAGKQQATGTSTTQDEIQFLSVTQPKDPLASIFEIFPDVQKSHAKKLWTDHDSNVAMVLSILSDGNYPKEKSAATSAAAAASTNFATAFGLTMKRAISAPKYDYLSQSSFQPSEAYKVQAMEQLSFDFPFLSKVGVSRLLEESKGHYAIVWETIWNMVQRDKAKDNKNDDKDKPVSPLLSRSEAGDDADEEQEYKDLRQLLIKRRATSRQLRRLSLYTATIKRPRSSSRKLEITDPILQDEIKHVHHRFKTCMEEMKGRIKRKRAREISLKAGTAMECSCCYDKVDMDEMVACKEEGHLFCVDCLKRYAESQIFGAGNLGIDRETRKPSLELKCCHGDGCNSAFHESHLQKALPFKTLEKYNELQFQASVELAGLGEEMWYV